MRGAERGNELGQESSMRLSDYVRGQKGRIIKIEGDSESRRRMSEMGFTRGVEVQVVKDAPLTDPVEYLVKGYHVSLRRIQADKIIMARPNEEAHHHE